MTLAVTCKRFESDEPGSSDKNQRRTYRFKYRITQTDTGSKAGAQSLIIAAQALMSGDILPVYGDNPTQDGDTDEDSYAQVYSWARPQPINSPKILDVTVDYLPADSVNPGRFTETDPLSWPTEYWVEWTEEQIVLHEAKNVDDLPQLNRSVGTLGKVVNAVGVEFTEPLMKTIYYPVLHCQKYYADLTDAIALNTTYQNTTNNGSFFGAATRKAKYLGTETGRVQKVNGVSFYTGITRVWFKDATWDRKVLNNGYSHLEETGGEYTRDSGGTIKIFPNLIFNEGSADGTDDDKTQRASEPLNLGLGGLLLSPEDDPSYMTYRDLAEVDYSGIGIGG